MADAVRRHHVQVGVVSVAGAVEHGQMVPSRVVRGRVPLCPTFETVNLASVRYSGKVVTARPLKAQPVAVV